MSPSAFLLILAILLVTGITDLDPNENYPTGTYEEQIQTARKKQVPILCYHHLRDSLGKHLLAYNITTHLFRSHIQMMYDSGYTIISPSQLYNYLVYDSSLPAKPALISFDDGYQEHFSIAARILDSFGCKGLFFIPAGVIAKKGCMDESSIRALSASGHSVGCHSWDHPDLRKVDSSAWSLQIDSAKSKLQKLTGKEVQYFAYPYGEWTDSSVQQLKRRGIIAAFQLTRKQSNRDPLFTIRRVSVPGDWSPAMLNKQLEKLFP